MGKLAKALIKIDIYDKIKVRKFLELMSDVLKINFYIEDIQNEDELFKIVWCFECYVSGDCMFYCQNYVR